MDLNGVDLVLESMFQVAVLCQLCETQIEVVIFLHSSLTKIVFSGFLTSKLLVFVKVFIKY